MKKIAIFASGSGSNTQKIIEYFSQSSVAMVDIILTNKKDAFVLERARNFHITSVVFNRNEFYRSEVIINLLRDRQIDLIVLAGFLWLVPDKLLQAFPYRIINIHPALLPAYGGKGMYGDRVHDAVIANREIFSGITIHYINDRYDEGDTIFQAKCNVDLSDDAHSLAEKIHSLEHLHFPRVIEEVLKGQEVRAKR
jgi:phosphoribosylglycinamide formyltransferase 1